MRIGVRLKLTPVCDRWHRLTDAQKRAVFMAMLGGLVQQIQANQGMTETQAAGEAAQFVGTMMDQAEAEA